MEKQQQAANVTASVTGKLWQQRLWGKDKTFCQPFTVKKKVTCWSGEEDRKLQWQVLFPWELLALRGLLANSGTIRASLSTIRVCNVTFKVTLQGYKQTSSPSFYALVYFRSKQTSLLAQKDSYPPRGHISWADRPSPCCSSPSGRRVQTKRVSSKQQTFSRGIQRADNACLLTAICARKHLGKFSVWTFCIQTRSDTKGLCLPHSKMSYHQGISWLCSQKTTPSVLAAGKIVAFFFPREAVSPNHWLKCYRPSWTLLQVNHSMWCSTDSAPTQSWKEKQAMVTPTKTVRLCTPRSSIFITLLSQACWRGAVSQHNWPIAATWYCPDPALAFFSAGQLGQWIEPGQHQHTNTQSRCGV